MMMVEDIRRVIEKRVKIPDEWSDGVERCCNEEIEILTRDMDETIRYLENDCTDVEFVLLSEVFDDVAAKTQNREFVECLYRVAQKFPEKCKEYYVDRVLRYAEGALNN